MKRKELKTQRKLFVGNPPPEQKKPRILTPAITIPVPTTDGRLRQRTVAPALEDPTDKASKHIDFIWKSVEWGLQEAVRKEKLQEYENFTDLEGLIRYVTAGGFRAFRNPKVIETLIALQEVVTSAKSKAEREQARREIETLLNAAKVLVQGRRPELTEKERKARKRTSNTAAKQDQRRLEYAARAKEKYCQRKSQVETKPTLSAEQKKAALKQIARQILDEEFSKEGVAKKLAKQDFRDLIKKDLL